MDKKIVFFIWIFLVLFIGPIHANERLKNEKLHLAGNGLIFYFEAEYELDNNVYVSDEIPTQPVYSIELKNRVLKISFFPRGNKVQIASESTHYPMLVRLVQSGNKLAFTIDFNMIISKAGLSLNDIDSFEIKIIDTVFYSKQKLHQCYLTQKDMYSLKHITSSLTIIDKQDYMAYWVKTNH
ncbi:hypothetical protein [Treponema sp.]|uniref:hypothetical protein n=1 Tax=Treponema sp. TaxID=166 RepID=UPI00298DD97C|nr:hypothetical protein [Treponema sp.]MCR5612267.1 hypothetical protein [Treponema sp.]